MTTSRICGVVGVLLGLMLACPTPAEKTYTVKRGDFLSKIAQTFSVSLEELISLNDISNPDRIYVGQEIQLPDHATVPEEQTARQEPAQASEVEEPAAAQPEESRQLSGRELMSERQRVLEKQQNEGQRLVSAAMPYVGTPYRRGGLNSRGIDCSGLVVRAMLNSQGRNVPHHAATLYTMGEKVTYEELQPGDLLFFNTSGRGVSHVGIWIGNNKFVHASTRNGVEVQFVAGYYAKRLVGARRLH